MVSGWSGYAGARHLSQEQYDRLREIADAQGAGSQVVADDATRALAPADGATSSGDDPIGGAYPDTGYPDVDVPSHADRILARWQDYDQFKARNIDRDRAALLAAGSGASGASGTTVGQLYDELKARDPNLDKDRAALLAVGAGASGVDAVSVRAAYNSIKAAEPTIDFDRAAILAGAAASSGADGVQVLRVYDEIKARYTNIDKYRAATLAASAVVGGTDASGAIRVYDAVKARVANIDNDRAAVLAGALLLRGDGTEGLDDLVRTYETVKTQPGESIDFHRAALLASTAFITDTPIQDVLEGYRSLKRGDIDYDRAAILTAGAGAALAGREMSTLVAGAWLQQELRRREADDYPDVPDTYPTVPDGPTSGGDDPSYPAYADYPYYPGMPGTGTSSGDDGAWSTYALPLAAGDS